jgi:hypothetical protein
VSLLESEKIALLETRAQDLEREVQSRTRSLEEKYQQETLVNDLSFAQKRIEKIPSDQRVRNGVKRENGKHQGMPSKNGKNR